jgi:polyribonucleotide nucleotidyltransferase
MASVCASALAMRDAGVPTGATVAGVAMGLYRGAIIQLCPALLTTNFVDEARTEPPPGCDAARHGTTGTTVTRSSRHVILTDILGLEDAFGEMDFKVVGTKTGITALQLDAKHRELTRDLLAEALNRARDARRSIIRQMDRAINKPNKMKDTIPKLVRFLVPPEKIGIIIGARGKTISALEQQFSVDDIVIDSNGLVEIQSLSRESNEAAKSAILDLISVDDEVDNFFPLRTEQQAAAKVITDRVVDEFSQPIVPSINVLKTNLDDSVLVPPLKVGDVVTNCLIVSHHDFGLFVGLPGGDQGLVHISELDFRRVSPPHVENGWMSTSPYFLCVNTCTAYR